MPCTDRRARSLLQRLLAPERSSASQMKLLPPKLANYVWTVSARLHRGDHHGSTAYTRRRGKPSTGPSWVLAAWIADRLTNNAVVAASEIECSQPCMADWCNAGCSPWRVVASARHDATQSTKMQAVTLADTLLQLTLVVVSFASVVCSTAFPPLHTLHAELCRVFAFIARGQPGRISQ